MRYNIHGVARSSYGTVLPNNNVRVYINGSDDTAIVYNSRTSNDKLSFVKTDEDGKFTIYFDSEDYKDYDGLDVKFDLEIGNNKIYDVEVFRTDRRVLNTNENYEEESVQEVIASLEHLYTVDGGTF